MEAFDKKKQLIQKGKRLLEKSKTKFGKGEEKLLHEMHRSGKIADKSAAIMMQIMKSLE